MKYVAKKINLILLGVVILLPTSILTKYVIRDESFPVSSIVVDFTVVAAVLALGFVLRLRIVTYVSEWQQGFDALFIKNPNPMWIYDMDGLRFLKVNEAACRLYGYSETEFTRLSITDIRPEEDVPALLEEVSNDRANTEMSYDWSGMWRHRKKNGNLIYVEVSSHKLLYKGRKASFALCYDVTRKVLQESELQRVNQKLEETILEKTHDLLRANQQLVEQNRAVKAANHQLGKLTEELKIANDKANEHAELKSRFVSMVSHEFRTPISSIRFSAEFVKRYYRKISTEQLLEKINCIENQTKHMEMLVKDVVTVGKNDVPAIKTSVTDLALDEFFKNLINEVSISANNSHTICYTTEGLPERLAIDEKLMRNIFINLLGNAIKYSPGKNHVYLKGCFCNGSIIFTIEDDGVGIAEEDKEKIFEPFFRSKSVDHLPGTGLGLSIVKRAVDLLGGKLSVEPRESGGSAFTVELPANLQ